MTPKEIFKEPEKTLGRVGLLMVTADTGEPGRISARTGPQMDEADSRVPARTSERGGSVTLKEISVERARTLAGGSKKTPKETFTVLAKTSEKVGSTMSISLGWMVPLFLGVVDLSMGMNVGYLRE